MEDYQLKLASGYEPGHISQAYGEVYTVLATLQPIEPKRGDLMAEFTVNGEFRFTLRAVDGSEEEEFWKSDDITPEVEAAIKNASDGEQVTYKGGQYIYDCRNNNWFECFAYEYGEDGLWHEISFDVDEADVGPTADELEATLGEYLETVREGCEE